jgi:hypothetical protein
MVAGVAIAEVEVVDDELSLVLAEEEVVSDIDVSSDDDDDEDAEEEDGETDGDDAGTTF